MEFDLQTVAVVGVLFVSTLVRSTFGFGDALLAMVVGLRTATPLVALVASTIALTILVRHWRAVRLASAWPFGIAAGILGGAYNTNGPPVVIYGLLRQWPPAAFRATLQGYFFPTGLFILAGHAAAGLWTRPVGEFFAFSLPVVLLAIWLGARLNRAIPEGKFDRSIHVLLLGVGVLLFVQTVV